MSLTNRGRIFLRSLQRQSPDWYNEIERKAEYPNQDDFTNSKEYDDAVDLAELKVMKEMIEEDLN